MRRNYAILCLLLVAVALHAQDKPSTQPGPSAPAPDVTFTTSTRVVLVDAVVTDKQGNPVHGLKAQDFVLHEDSKPQQVRGFEERRADAVPAPAAPVQLPPNTYTNYLDSQQQSAANIILFDTLNTSRNDLMQARQQLLLYLSKMPPRARVALYSLDSQLRLIHGFTEDPKDLIELAKTLSTSPHPMYSNAAQTAGYAAMAQEMIANPALRSHTISYLWAEQQSREETRMTVTMEALSQLARSMAVVPGRKNLIWISGGVPFDPASTSPQMQRVAALFAATQISAYPIDVRGAAVLGADASIGGKQAFYPYGGSYEENSGVSAELRSSQDTMTILANLTGGSTHFNSNDLAGSIAKSIEAGSNYYILAYRPENQDWNGKFRKVSVKTADHNLSVTARPGYYAVTDPLKASNLDRAFSLAMQPGIPPSTTLIIKTLVKPGGKTQVDTLVDVHDLTMVESDDHHHEPDVMFVAAVWTDKGKPAGNDTATFRQKLTAEQLQVLQRVGLRSHQELALKPGVYDLRIGVLDYLSGKMGTIDVPLTVGPEQPPSAPAAPAKP